MAKVEIYSTMFCPYCGRARSLLTKKGVTFIDIDVDTEPGMREEMMARSHGRMTVPQIFVDGTHIGGADELAALDREGKLDRLLGLGS